MNISKRSFKIKTKKSLARSSTTDRVFFQSPSEVLFIAIKINSKNFVTESICVLFNVFNVIIFELMKDYEIKNILLS